ncbi:hypothetical protein K0H71_07755 [Bacillus sp. IITD106]|nr:hypothetical protein [Bacillus sp. IITD106]
MKYKILRTDKAEEQLRDIIFYDFAENTRDFNHEMNWLRIGHDSMSC